MVYLNYAATSYPKPEIVIKTLYDSLNSPPSGQFRSAGIFENSEVFFQCRKRLAEILGIGNEKRIFFSSGSTEGLNCIFHGLGIKAENIVTTVTEHNSVLRPLMNMDGIKGTPQFAECDENGFVDPAKIEGLITESTEAIVVNHCSNVTGAVQDIASIGRIAKKYGILLILDCSQSAGCIPIKADEWGVDALAFTGHKSLFSVQGTGGYYIRDGVDFKPLKYGGTGKDSRIIDYSDSEYEYEVGTQNSNGIAALNVACSLILEQGVDEIFRKEEKIAEYLISSLEKIEGVHIYGKDLNYRGPVVSIRIDGIKCSDAAYIMQNSYGVVLRSGLQCAPLIHEHIGSAPEGTLRISFSQYTTKEDIDAAIEGISDIAVSLG